jgi:hypothetical protein
MKASRTNLPKVSLIRLSLYISEWFLLSEDSEIWVDEPRVLIAWHLFFFSTSVVMLVTIAARLLFTSVLENSAVATLILRWWECAGIGATLPIYATLAARFYQHLLLTGRDLRFRSVALFWCVWIILFGLLYYLLYLLAPTSINYQHPVFVPQTTLVAVSILLKYKMIAYFMTYSACIATAISFPNITSNSLVASILNVAEATGSILFIALIVATFAGKAISGKGK